VGLIVKMIVKLLADKEGNLLKTKLRDIVGVCNKKLDKDLLAKVNNNDRIQ
jgi:hypothetical protein